MQTSIKLLTKRPLNKSMEIKEDTIFKRVFKSPSAKLGGVLLLFIFLTALFASILAPFDPYAMDWSSISSGPSKAHWFGTDKLGRDILSRLMYGARYSLTLGLVSAMIGNLIGIALGCYAGFFGGKADMYIMRFCDLLQSIPDILLTILIAASLGAGFFHTVLAMSVGGFAGAARMTRGQILAERKKEYLEAAKSINCSNTKIIFKHLLPNIISPVLVHMTMMIGGHITAAAGLSYLGLGVQPPLPEWGSMLSEGLSYFRTYPHLMLFPGIAIGLCVLAINLVGDGLRDALDPKLRN